MIRIAFILVLFALCSCSKKDSDTPVEVKGVVHHHKVPIPLARVYIKFNSREFPGADLGVYNRYTDADSNGNYKLKDLPKGNHYLYGVGYDWGVSDSVFGGMPLQIKGTVEHKTVDVAVTE